MAMRLEAGEILRGDQFWIYPEHIIVDMELNGRKEHHSRQRIEDLAQSILRHGQQQAVVVRRVAGNHVQLVAGYGRHAAVQHINSVLRPSDKVKLKCAVQDLNEEEAFVANIVENKDRVDLTPIDHAHNQRRLRDRFGWDDPKIALPALSIKDMPAAEQKAVISEAKDPETGKIKSQVITQKVRERKIQEGGAKARTLSEVKTFFTELTGPAEDGFLKSLSILILDFIAGKVSDGDTGKELDRLAKGLDGKRKAS